MMDYKENTSGLDLLIIESSKTYSLYISIERDLIHLNSE